MNLILAILKIMTHALPLLQWFGGFYTRIRRRKKEKPIVTNREELEKSLDDGTF